MNETPCARAVVGPVYDDPLVHRLLPAPDQNAEFFWQSGRDGRLRIQRCSDCGYYIHPPTGYCPACGGTQCAPAVVSGRGTVYTFTINYQPWTQNQLPYVVAIVELEEQIGLRLTSNVVNCNIAEVRIGMPVAVGFVAHGDRWYSVFAPVDGCDHD